LIGAHKSSIDFIGQRFLEGRNGISSRPCGQIIVLGLACVETSTWWKLSGDVARYGAKLADMKNFLLLIPDLYPAEKLCL
jgi:hypothetical protein